MDLKDKYLDRIADALEEQMGVSPKLIGGNVLKPNIYRIADALDPEPTPLQDGTLKNPLARIAEVIESGGFGGSGSGYIIEGTEAPNNEFGNDYSFYTYNNNLYVKTNGWWKYVGYYDSHVLPLFPDGVSIPNKYFVMKNANEELRRGTYYVKLNQDLINEKILIIPVILSTVDILDENRDIIPDTNLKYNVFGLYDEESLNISAYGGNSKYNCDVYIHNIFYGTIKCCGLFDGSNSVLSNDNPTDISISLYSENVGTMANYAPFVDKDTSSRLMRKDSNNVVIRLVDDTVIQAFHQFVLNNEA